MNVNRFVLSCFSRVQLFMTLWTVDHQAPLSMGFSRQEYWSEFPCPPSGDLPNPGIKPTSHVSALAVGFFTTSATWETLSFLYHHSVNSFSLSSTGSRVPAPLTASRTF